MSVLTESRGIMRVSRKFRKETIFQNLFTNLNLIGDNLENGKEQ